MTPVEKAQRALSATGDAAIAARKAAGEALKVAVTAERAEIDAWHALFVAKGDVKMAGEMWARSQFLYVRRLDADRVVQRFLDSNPWRRFWG